MSKLSQLKAQLTSCFDPETLKDILYELHEIPPEQSHATVSLCTIAHVLDGLFTLTNHNFFSLIV